MIQPQGQGEMPVHSMGSAAPEVARRPTTRRAAIVAFVAYWLVLILLTHWPNPFPGVGEPRHFDKLAHFSLYGLLAALAGNAALAVGRVRLSMAGIVARLAIVFAAVVLFGLADELTQPLTGRDCDAFDWLADSLGAACGVLLISRRWRS